MSFQSKSVQELYAQFRPIFLYFTLCQGSLTCTVHSSCDSICQDLSRTSWTAISLVRVLSCCEFFFTYLRIRSALQADRNGACYKHGCDGYTDFHLFWSRFDVARAYCSCRRGGIHVLGAERACSSAFPPYFLCKNPDILFFANFNVFFFQVFQLYIARVLFEFFIFERSEWQAGTHSSILTCFIVILASLQAGLGAMIFVVLGVGNLWTTLYTYYKNRLFTRRNSTPRITPPTPSLQSPDATKKEWAACSRWCKCASNEYRNCDGNKKLC